MKKVALLLGGFSKEREVSLLSGSSTSKALVELGYNVVEIDVTDNLPALVTTLKKESPDVAFNCLHGTIGEDGNIQAILNYLKIPYTHSGVLASALAMNKWQAYKLFTANNIPTPKTWVLKIEKNCQPPLPFPLVIKPINEGSSVGVKLIHNSNDWDDVILSWNFGEFAIIQEYINGREINVAVLNNEALGTIEIHPIGHEFFDYTSKYTPGHLETTCPANISESLQQQALTMAVSTYKAIGCRSLARVDMLLKNDQFYVLEINTQPGFTSTSLAPKIAHSKGVTFNQLVDNLVRSAQCD